MNPCSQRPGDIYDDKILYSGAAGVSFVVVIIIIALTVTYIVIGAQHASVMYDSESLANFYDEDDDDEDALGASLLTEHSYDTFATGNTCRADAVSTYSSSSTQFTAVRSKAPNTPANICSAVDQRPPTCSCPDQRLLDLLKHTDLERAVEDYEGLMRKAAALINSIRLGPLTDANNSYNSGRLKILGQEITEATIRLIHSATSASRSREESLIAAEKALVYTAATLWLNNADMNTVEGMINDTRLLKPFSLNLVSKAKLTILLDQVPGLRQ